MQSNMYSRLETNPSLFLALPGIFEARFFSRAPRIPVNPARYPRIPISENPDIWESRYQRIPISENPDIRESRYPRILIFFRSAEGACFKSTCIQDGCSVCAHDNMMIYSWPSRSNLKTRGKVLSIESNWTVIESNRTLIETNRINQEKLWKIRLIRLPFDWFDQSNDWIRLVSINLIANRRSIAFDWLRLEWKTFFPL